ncbi:unnamed protein product [Cyprideis torosa]|uniref:Protein white n=1 Tax=Cyprideis torosa TaxID=163714 RepID=A0A7R8W3Z6_9CRUS|nr:unnamed protein product [Cyprideis torosa]CAG0883457.1 unnamed protein product [Cyprideis torosa]
MTKDDESDPLVAARPPTFFRSYSSFLLDTTLDNQGPNMRTEQNETSFADPQTEGQASSKMSSSPPSRFLAPPYPQPTHKQKFSKPPFTSRLGTTKTMFVSAGTPQFPSPPQEPPATPHSSSLSQLLTLSWHNLNVYTSGFNSSGSYTLGGRKHILKDVSGVVRPGELLAIMGASGAGKTTLLNTLTFRSGNELTVAGTIRLNGLPVGGETITAISAYVTQDDIFMPTLTVREHLQFQAMLRLAEDLTMEQRMERVEEAILELGLTKCADSLIGSLEIGGSISGGERRRLAFASEALTNPPLLFCDEPTSGLDSYMAQTTIGVLRTLAGRGRTLVCTIHQPSSEVFSLFDRLLLLADGRTAFLGDTHGAAAFFREQGFNCPQNYNPADFYINTLAIDPGDEEISKARVRKICDAFAKQGKKEKEIIIIKVRQEERPSPYKVSCWLQFRAVIWRSWLSMIREPMIIKVRLLEVIAVALIQGLVFLSQPLNAEGINNINGALFLLINNMTFQNAFAIVSVFCSEYPILLREHQAGMYRITVYFLCKALAEIPLFVFYPVLFCSVTFFMIGYMISCVSSNMHMGLSVGPAIIVPFMLFGGYYLHADSVPKSLGWLRYLSWYYYGNEALAINQWKNLTNIDCGASNMSCPKDGNSILQGFAFDPNRLAADVGYLFCLIFGFRLLGLAALSIRTSRRDKH